MIVKLAKLVPCKTKVRLKLQRRRQKKIKIREEPSHEKKRPKEPRDASDIFQEINIKRKSSMRPKSAHGNLNNSEPRLIQHMTR